MSLSEAPNSHDTNRERLSSKLAILQHQGSARAAANKVVFFLDVPEHCVIVASCGGGVDVGSILCVTRAAGASGTADIVQMQQLGLGRYKRRHHRSPS